MTDNDKTTNGIGEKQLATTASLVQVKVLLEFDSCLAQGEDLRTPEEAEERVLDVLRERVIEPMKQGLSDLSESGLPYFDMALNVDVSSRSTDLPVILEPDQGTEEELSEQYPGTVWERKTRAEFDLEREMESRSERANSADTGPEEDGGCNIPYPHTHLPDGTPVPVLPILVGSGEEERAIPLEDLPDLLYRIARDVAQRREEEETVSGFKRDVSLEA